MDPADEGEGRSILLLLVLFLQRSTAMVSRV
jgi:hypothetical protein